MYSMVVNNMVTSVYLTVAKKVGPSSSHDKKKMVTMCEC